MESLLLSGVTKACVEGAAVIGLVWLICRCCPRLPAAARFLLWWLASAKLVLTLALCAVSVPLPVLPAYHAETLSRIASLAPGTPVRVKTTKEPQGTPATEVAPKTIPTANAPVTLIAAPNRPIWPVLLLATWLTGIAVSLSFLVRDAVRLRRLCRISVPAPVDTEELRSLTDAMRLRSIPSVLVAPGIASPLVTGLWRSVILLPVGFLDTANADERRMALAHEMAHLQRGDLWLALLPALARAVFWWYPPVYLVVREGMACREEAADDLALRFAGGKTATYASLLVKLASVQTAPTVAISMASPAYSSLKRRLRTLKTSAGRPTGRGVRALAFALTGLTALPLVPLRLTTAQTKPILPSLTAPIDELPTYTVTDLGTLGGKYSHAYGLNEAGQVVGTANVYPLGSMGHAFLHDGEQMRDLSHKSIYRHSLATDINEAGKVAASAYRSSYRAGEQFAFVWNGKQRVYIGSLPGYKFSRAVGINNGDMVAGNALSGRTNPTGATVSRAFLWQAGRMTDLGTLGGSHSHALALNDTGKVVGKSDLPANAGTHAFLYDNGVLRDLGTLPGGRNSLALGVNTQGVTVGTSETGDKTHAFVWTEQTGMTDLGTPEDFAASAAYGVNDNGAIVGQAASPDKPYQAVVWLPNQNGTTQPINLNERLAPGEAAWLLETARAINNKGWIVGQGILNGQKRAFLLKPVTESGT